MLPELNSISKNRNQLTGLMWGLLAILKPNNDEKSITCALDFAEWIALNKELKDKDICVTFCRCMAGSGDAGSETIRAAALTNPKIAALISKATNSPDNKKRFIVRLQERPNLQEVIKRVSWGSDEDEKKAS